MPRQIHGSLEEQLSATKLQIERAKLAKLEAEAPPKGPPQYTRYEDLPPPNPEERERFLERLSELVGCSMDDAVREHEENRQAYFDWLLQFADDWP